MRRVPNSFFKSTFFRSLLPKDITRLKILTSKYNLPSNHSGSSDLQLNDARCLSRSSLSKLDKILIFCRVSSSSKNCLTRDAVRNSSTLNDFRAPYIISTPAHKNTYTFGMRNFNEYELTPRFFATYTYKY